MPMEKIPQLEVGQHRITQQRILKVSCIIQQKKDKSIFADVHTNGGEFQSRLYKHQADSIYPCIYKANFFTAEKAPIS